VNTESKWGGRDRKKLGWGGFLAKGDVILRGRKGGPETGGEGGKRDERSSGKVNAELR